VAYRELDVKIDSHGKGMGYTTFKRIEGSRKKILPDHKRLEYENNYDGS
jgi:hypothetical protein